jgi:deazaflavin-dependent oxidoreductase (nitroreductase family)
MIPYVEPVAPTALRRPILRLLSSPPMAASERSLPFRLIVWRLAPRLMCLTGGRLAALLPFPTAVIETRDLRNGRPHRRLVVYFNDGDNAIVVASRGGGPRDPFWLENAVLDPAVRLGGGAYRAAVVTDEIEQARLWELAERFYPPYASYRAHSVRSGRSIPLLELRPR